MDNLAPVPGQAAAEAAGMQTDGRCRVLVSRVEELVAALVRDGLLDADG